MGLWMCSRMANGLHKSVRVPRIYSPKSLKITKQFSIKLRRKCHVDICPCPINFADTISFFTFRLPIFFCYLFKAYFKLNCFSNNLSVVLCLLKLSFVNHSSAITSVWKKRARLLKKCKIDDVNRVARRQI